MRRAVWAWSLLGVLGTGCDSTPPPIVVESLVAQLDDLQHAERDLLPLVPGDLPAQNFGTVTAPVLLPPRDGWRLQLQAWQLRAAALIAWAQGKPFDGAPAR
jgi:hypothetical protein